MDWKVILDELREFPLALKAIILSCTALTVLYFYDDKKAVFYNGVVLAAALGFWVVVAIVINFILNKFNNYRGNRKKEKYDNNKNQEELSILKKLSEKEKYIIKVILYNKKDYIIDENSNTIKQLIKKNIVRDEYLDYMLGIEHTYALNDWVKELIEKDPSILK